jgi:uncharacterized protein
MIYSSICIDAQSLELDPLPLDPRQILEGAPTTHLRVIWTSDNGKEQRGVWQITPGVVRDVELDEMFVVLNGRATVQIEGGATLHLQTGSVGILRGGDRSIWRVHETLRKVYHLVKP